MITPTRSDLNFSFNYLRHCRRILDVGCGTGEFIKLSPQKIVGLDTNRQTLSICRRQGLKVKFGSAIKISYSPASFDGLHCSHVIEHFQPKQVYTFLKAASRVLAPKGILVISSPVLWSGFYNNLTHIKPYPPRAITRYLVETAPDTTYPNITAKFKLVTLHWRYRYFTKTGYTLVLRKC